MKLLTIVTRDDKVPFCTFKTDDEARDAAHWFFEYDPPGNMVGFEITDLEELTHYNTFEEFRESFDNR